MANPNEHFFTCIHGLTPDEHRDAFRALSRKLPTIRIQSGNTPRMINAASFFTYLNDADAYERYLLPQVPVLVTCPDDYMETFPEHDSEADDPGKERWISPGIALRFAAELREVTEDLFAFLNHFNDPGFFSWLQDEGDADGIPFSEALRDILRSGWGLPNIQLRDMPARIMSMVWRAESERLEEQHPGVSAELLAMNEAMQSSDEIHADFKRHHMLFEHALMEAHCWKEHGVSSADFVFPTFFGLDITALAQPEGGQE